MTGGADAEAQRRRPPWLSLQRVSTSDRTVMFKDDEEAYGDDGSQSDSARESHEL